MYLFWLQIWRGTKGYVVFDLKTREISVSQNVVFYEHIFPYFTASNNHFHDTDNSNTCTDSLNFLFDPPISHIDYTHTPNADFNPDIIDGAV